MAKLNLVGKTLGQYQIVEEIGRGGFGAVYKAWQGEPLNRYVALKVLPAQPEERDDETVKRFRQEAMLAARLNHPHIVPVYDAGYVEGCYYIAMEYLEGGSLADLVRQGMPDMFAALRLLAQVGTALDFAHRNGVVAHRDVKPSNVLLTKDRQWAKLSDFGIAVLSHGSILDSSGQSVIGTPVYMSPEHIQPHLRVDTRSDVYSFGVMLYEVFTGRLPFWAEDPYAVGVMHLTEKPLPPRRLRPRMTRELQQLILKCLEKRREDRFQSVAEVVEALRPQRVVRPLVFKAHPLDPGEKAYTLEDIVRIAGARPDVVIKALYSAGKGSLDAWLERVGREDLAKRVRDIRSKEPPATGLKTFLRRVTASYLELQIEQLILALRSKDVDLREEAERQLLGIGVPVIEVAFERGFTYAERELALRLAKVIGRMGVSAVEPLLNQCRRGKSVLILPGYTRSLDEFPYEDSVAAMLATIGESAVERLIHALGDPNGNVRSAAADALGEIGAVRAVELLIRALADPDVIVRWAAARALGKIGDMRALEPNGTNFSSPCGAEVPCASS